jgi:L-asparaginase
MASDSSVSDRPRVYVIGTGGTISTVGDSRNDYMNYSYGNRHLSIEEMLERVPEVNGFAEVVPEQLINVGSTEVEPSHWLQLARRINRIFTEDPQAAGVAVTHGTATLEETAYFLNLTVRSRKPVVVTGAMRPASGLGTDSDVNLIDCVRVAAAPAAAGRGVLTVLNNEIQASRDVTKTNSYRLETFRSNELGFLGYADSDEEVVFYRTPTRSHTADTEFDADGVAELPRVDIAYAYAGADDLVIKAVADAGVPGLVAAGLGSGGSSPKYMRGLREAQARGVRVVIASHTGNGRVMRTKRFTEEGFVVADNLSPKKARILLMLGLTVTNDADEIQRMMLTY